MNIAALKKKSQCYKATLNLEYMFKINLISVFLLLFFGIYAVQNHIESKMKL
jgi:hypothetical protein